MLTTLTPAEQSPLEQPMKFREVQMLYAANSKNAPLLIKARRTVGRGRNKRTKWFVWEWIGIGLIEIENPSPDVLAKAQLVED